MRRGQKQSENHPKKGSCIKVDPIRDLKSIKRIKHYLSEKPRDFCLFTLGINTAYRTNELLSVRVCDVAHLQVGDGLELKQSKVNKYRKVTVNKNVVNAVADIPDSNSDIHIERLPCPKNRACCFHRTRLKPF